MPENKEIKPFKDLEREHFGGTGSYHKDGLLKAYYTDGVTDFMTTYGAGWFVTDLMLRKEIRQAKDMVYPSLVVKDHKAYAFKDCDHAEIGKDKPLFVTNDLLHCLPEGKLNFVFSPFENILCLMMEN